MSEMTTARLALRRAIVSVVEQSQGVKATELAVVVIASIGGQAVDSEFADELEALIKEGEIVEIEYVLPQMDWMAKSFLLPKGVKIRIITPPKGGPAPIGALPSDERY